MQILRCDRCELLDDCETRWGYTLCPECYAALATLIRGFMGEKIGLLQVDTDWLKREINGNDNSRENG